MQLSKNSLSSVSFPPATQIPSAGSLVLPEKVIQFGTGVLLRGLIDYFIDKANRQGTFGGRVVVIKSTERGNSDEFNDQDGLYTHTIRGIDNGKEVNETIINSSISRVLSAQKDWNEILKCAINPDIRIIVSNTTEVGITLTEDDIQAEPPASFPGKLLALLYARWEAGMSGFVIVPTELVPDNGKKLKGIVIELARQNMLEPDFVAWIEHANTFCNSLVDRIVPGKLPQEDRHFSYTDELAILSEPYSLWAIESAIPEVAETLSFAKADKGVVIAPDIAKYRELKLRMLNGTHTMTCGVAVLAGIETVKEGMNDAALASFLKGYMMKEVAPAISGELVSLHEAKAYGETVLDRFRNPFIRHKWLSITLQYTSKMRMRNVPLLLKHYEIHGTPPPYFALGFAAYLLFMKSEKRADGFYGSNGTAEYLLQDDQAAYFHQLWKDLSAEQVVAKALRNTELWGYDLTLLARFEALVTENLFLVASKGMRVALETVR